MNPIDKILENAEWTEIEAPPITDGSIYATHRGVLSIGDITLNCWQLSNGKRMLDAQSIVRLCGFNSSNELADSIAELGNQELAERLRHPVEIPVRS